MTLLWIGCAGLLALVVIALLWPLTRAGRTHQAQQAFEAHDLGAAANVRVFRQRLASLEASRAGGELSEAHYHASRLELERSLLEDTEGAAPRPLKPARAGLWLVPPLVLAVVGGALYLYHARGAAGDLELYAVRQDVVASGDTSPAHFINRFEAEAERQPDNPNVWATLFPLYRDSGNFAAAGASLERLIALAGRDPGLVAELAQMRYFAAGRRLTPEVRALVAEVLNKDPRQPTVHGMLGFAAFQHGDYQGAIEHWRLAIAGFDDDDSQDALREAIGVARQRLGERADAGAGAASGAADDMQESSPAQAATPP